MPAAKNQTNGLLTTAIQSPVDPTLLPPGNDASLQLELADPAEHEQTWRLNVDEWKGLLSEPDYYSREQHLMASPMTNKGQLTAWILTSPKLPASADGTRPILSSCETYMKNAYVAKNGRLERIFAHGVGSVFSRNEYRGKGYAGRMIAEIGKKLQTWQQPNGNQGTFSVLYSDIGKKFYAKHNWEPFPSDHITLAPLEVNKQAFSSEVVDLKTADLADIPAIQYLEETLIKQSKEKPGVPHVAFKPDLGHFRWHHMREEFVCSAMGRPFPEIKGVLHRPTGIALIWNRMMSSEAAHNHLSVLLVVVPPALRSSPEATKVLSTLLLRAQHEAYTWGMTGGVEIWDPSDNIVQAAQQLRKEEDGKVEIISRDTEHICSLRWNGPEKEVVWVGSERYAWC